MKRILALLIACVLFASTSLCTYAAGNEKKGGSTSVTAEDIKEMQDTIDRLSKRIKSLESTIKATQQSGNKAPAKPSGGLSAA